MPNRPNRGSPRTDEQAKINLPPAGARLSSVSEGCDYHRDNSAAMPPWRSGRCKAGHERREQEKTMNREQSRHRMSRVFSAVGRVAMMATWLAGFSVAGKADEAALFGATRPRRYNVSGEATLIREALTSQPDTRSNPAR